MRKTKTFLIIGIVAFGTIGVLYIIFGGSYIYSLRYAECDPNKVLPVVARAFDVNFPRDIRDVKAAKTRNRDGAISFVIKFTADPNTVSRFLNSYVVGQPSRPYVRKFKWTTNGFISPRWARQGFEEGITKTVTSNPDRGDVGLTSYIYVDITNKKKYTVYIEGLY